MLVHRHEGPAERRKMVVLLQLMVWQAAERRKMVISLHLMLWQACLPLICLKSPPGARMHAEDTDFAILLPCMAALPQSNNPCVQLLASAILASGHFMSAA